MSASESGLKTRKEACPKGGTRLESPGTDSVKFPGRPCQNFLAKYFARFYCGLPEPWRSVTILSG
jgi:hypothetical protein